MNRRDYGILLLIPVLLVNSDLFGKVYNMYEVSSLYRFLSFEEMMLCDPQLDVILPCLHIPMYNK